MPRHVKAIYIGSASSDALKRCDAGEVHSVFERTFNILTGGELVGVARSDIYLSPINLITDIPTDETMPFLGVKKGMLVQVAGDHVLVSGALEISLESSEIWRPKTRAERCLDLESIKRNLELAKQLAASKAMREGLGQLLLHIDEIATGKMRRTSDLNVVARTVLPQLIDLTRATKSGNVEGVRRVAQKLIGLGPGLSPSADDALMGFMVALWWITNSLGKDIDRVRIINNAIVSCVGGTTLLSQQLLKHASRGETNEAVENLLEAILAGPPTDVGTSVEKVSAIGETSGVDMMAGLLVGVQVGLQVVGSSRPLLG